MNTITLPKAAWTGFLRGALLAGCACGVAGLAAAQMAESGNGDPSAAPRQRSVGEWLLRLQQAARVPSYIGTFVVSARHGSLSSARIWHVQSGQVQLERVEVLTGTPRSTFRRNDQVVIFSPASRTVRTVPRETGNKAFPRVPGGGAPGSTADFYAAREVGEDRVAGFSADIVQFSPRDGLRFGYRIWSEKRTGLAVKTQTLDHTGQVLEQAAFSELQLDAPVKAGSLQRMMNRTEGYRVEKSARVPTTAEAEGWHLKAPVPGFKPEICYQRAAGGGAVQWIFSDGLAPVSLFIEPFDAARHTREGSAVVGATHTLARRLTGTAADWWVTAVGEVPVATLGVFVDNLERRP